MSYHEDEVVSEEEVVEEKVLQLDSSSPLDIVYVCFYLEDKIQSSQLVLCFGTPQIYQRMMVLVSL